MNRPSALIAGDTLSLLPGAPLVETDCRRGKPPGVSGWTVKATEFEGAPEEEFTTLISCAPAEARSLAGICAKSCVWLPEAGMVGRGLPFHRTVAVPGRLQPVTGTVKPGWLCQPVAAPTPKMLA